MFESLGFPEILVLAFTTVVYGVCIGVPAGIICRRAGHSPWLGIVALIPVANIGLLWFLATAPWNPVQSGGPSRKSSRQLLTNVRAVISILRGRGPASQP
jgi:hypothetical protein